MSKEAASSSSHQLLGDLWERGRWGCVEGMAGIKGCRDRKNDLAAEAADRRVLRGGNAAFHLHIVESGSCYSSLWRRTRTHITCATADW